MGVAVIMRFEQRARRQARLVAAGSTLEQVALKLLGTPSLDPRVADLDCRRPEMSLPWNCCRQVSIAQ